MVTLSHKPSKLTPTSLNRNSNSIKKISHGHTHTYFLHHFCNHLLLRESLHNALIISTSFHCSFSSLAIRTDFVGLLWKKRRIFLLSDDSMNSFSFDVKSDFVLKFNNLWKVCCANAVLLVGIDPSLIKFNKSVEDRTSPCDVLKVLSIVV